MLISLASGLLTGTSLLNVFSTLPLLFQVEMGCGTLLVASLFFYSAKQALFKTLAMFLLSVVLGFGWAYFAAMQKLQWVFPTQDTQQLVSICGKVDGVTQRREKTLRFDVNLEHYNGKPLSLPAKIRLYWQNPQHNVMDRDSLCAQVKLKPRWHLSNPGSVDLEKQYFLEGIAATGKVVQLQHYQTSSGFALTRLRQQLNDNLAVLIGDKPFLGVIQATTLGVYHNITKEQWQIFQATGTVHAVAISGLHISVIAMLCGGWVTFVVRRFPKLTSRMPAKCYGAIMALLGALIYSSLAGFGIPTQRALVMIVITIVSLFKRQPLLTWQSLALACIGILLVDPLAPLQVGFWLSFSCVAALIYGASHSALTGWRKWVVPQWLVFIGLMPLCVFYFQQISWISPIANMIALPVIDLIVVPCCLIGLFLSFVSSTLATIFLSVANGLLEHIGWLLEKMTHFSFHVAETGSVPLGYIVIALIAAVLMLAPQGIPARRWAWLGFLPMLLYQAPVPSEGECFFALLDVGQGLAAVVQTKNYTLLFDAGPVEAGNRVIKPFLRSAHIKHLDKVIISHGDLDHRGGLQAFDKDTFEILSSEPQRLQRKANLCKAGERWEWDGVSFMLLNPGIQDPSAKSRNRNNLSCVLKVSTANHSILLTGDIEHNAEQFLLATYSALLPSTILVVPHHGSLTSSSQDFVHRVHPKYALFPVGLANQYGFPKQAVLKRYEGMGAKNLLVSHTGALLFRLGQNAELAPPTSWRESTRRYWHRALINGE